MGKVYEADIVYDEDILYESERGLAYKRPDNSLVIQLKPPNLEEANEGDVGIFDGQVYEFAKTCDGDLKWVEVLNDKGEL